MTTASPGPVRTPGQTPTPPDLGSGRHPQHGLIKTIWEYKEPCFLCREWTQGPNLVRNEIGTLKGDQMSNLVATLRTKGRTGFKRDR